MNIKTWTTGIILCVGLTSGATAFAANEKKADANAAQDQATSVSAEQKKAMAEMHQKMADCLKSDKSFQECQDQMRQNCQHCNGMMWHHQGMMGHGMGWGYCGMMGPGPDQTNQ